MFLNRVDPRPSGCCTLLWWSKSSSPSIEVSTLLCHYMLLASVFWVRICLILQRLYGFGKLSGIHCWYIFIDIRNLCYRFMIISSLIQDLAGNNLFNFGSQISIFSGEVISMLDPRSLIPNPWSQILDARTWIPDPRPQIWFRNTIGTTFLFVQHCFTKFLI
jgi:hypothetical protein